MAKTRSPAFIVAVRKEEGQFMKMNRPGSSARRFAELHVGRMLDGVDAWKEKSEKRTPRITGRIKRKKKKRSQ